MKQAEKPLSTGVLVAEDEPLIRMLAVEMVEEAGFEAHEAGSADNAISVLEKHKNICILFTDVNMPGTMDGLKLAQYVHNRWPSVKIIVTTGRRALGPDQLPSGTVFLQKPYSLGCLANKLREIGPGVGDCAG